MVRWRQQGGTGRERRCGPARGVDLVALDQALDKLAQLDPRQSRIVELRLFGGLTEDETPPAKLTPWSSTARAQRQGTGQTTINKE
jgi:hypothetical protein